LKIANKPKEIINWLMGDVTAFLKSKQLSLKNSKLSPELLGSMIDLIAKGTISGKIAKDIIVDILETGKKPETIIQEKGLLQVSDESALTETIVAVINENPESVNSIKAGKPQAIGFLVGQVMKKTGGKANPAVVNKLLKEALGV